MTTLPRKCSPWTDPRALVGSGVFHACLLLVASAIVLGIALPRTARPPENVLKGELGPVDNRAPTDQPGGAEGRFGGEGLEAGVAVAVDGPKPPQDATAETLLAEALSATGKPPEEPGPISELGVLPGPGTGGGGGSGGGSGGGVGKGFGPGTEFFGAKEQGESFVYAIDCSGSMTRNSALEVAKRELLASLGRLPFAAKFGVVFYNQKPTVFADPSGHAGLMAATLEAKARVRTRLREIPADGSTNHMLALRAALAMKPEVLFFLTDADFLTPGDVDEILRLAGSTRIQAVEFGDGPNVDESPLLRKLAAGAGGSYRYIDTQGFAAGGDGPGGR